MTGTHPLQRLFWAENLVRRRRSDERQRYAASQRRGRVDPNPHQIDAVVFALRRIPEGGCILADEVGLGKTIEAGLIIAQLLAESARRILVIVPKPLLGQWQSELYTLFGIEAREVRFDPDSLAGPGVFLVGRELAGGDKGSSLIATAEPFDLCVIDEAHEVFAGLYRRFGRAGQYSEDSQDARMAHRVRAFLGTAPVLLLTATPIQNSLAELWGLVQYVEPTGTLLGDLRTFREVFCEPGSTDRRLLPAQADELRERLNTVCQRTLRRQAQEFLERPFTRRRTKLFSYSMRPDERSLYDDVTTYLLEPSTCAFSGNSRRLLLISFHRLMASSLPALAKSLRKVAQRLERQFGTTVATSAPLASAPLASAPQAEELLADLDDAEFDDEDIDGEPVEVPQARVREELARVSDFIQRAEALPNDSKAECLLSAVKLVLAQGQNGDGSGKLVIFTESLTTQSYLEQLLLEGELGLQPSDITLFRGTNDSPRALQALEYWRSEVEAHLPSANRPSKQVAMRLALVHEFRTRSRIFISTEAGAKGLNLQFCDTLVNYDLPWNPQRIEQRIGRCHRYAQTRDVTVINFLSTDNETQQLTFQLLSEKLDLFGQVLDASDAVLHEPHTDAPESLATALGAEVESQLRRIYERARSRDELNQEIRHLADTLEDQRQQFEAMQRRMQGLIQSRFDESVRQVFRQISDELPSTLAELDRDLDRVVTSFLEALQVQYARSLDEDGRILLDIPAQSYPDAVLSEGGQFVIGHARDLGDRSPIHLSHPLVLAALDEARRSAAATQCVRIQLTDRGSQLEEFRGRRGRLLLGRLQHKGFEAFDRILPIMLLDSDEDLLPTKIAAALLNQQLRDAPELAHSTQSTADDVEEALEAILFDHQIELGPIEQQRFEKTLGQLERYIEDQVLVLRRERHQVQHRFAEAQRKREGILALDTRDKLDQQLHSLEESLEKLDQRIAALERREDADYARWRHVALDRCYAQAEIERLAEVEFVVT